MGCRSAARTDREPAGGEGGVLRRGRPSARPQRTLPRSRRVREALHAWWSPCGRGDHRMTVGRAHERLMTALFIFSSCGIRQNLRMRVLVVEDEPRMASVIGRSLGREGVATDLAA